MNRIRFVHVALVALVAALAVPAAGVSKSTAMPTSVWLTVLPWMTTTLWPSRRWIAFTCCAATGLTK